MSFHRRYSNDPATTTTSSDDINDSVDIGMDSSSGDSSFSTSYDEPMKWEVAPLPTLRKRSSSIVEQPGFKRSRNSEPQPETNDESEQWMDRGYPVVEEDTTMAMYYPIKKASTSSERHMPWEFDDIPGPRKRPGFEEPPISKRPRRTGEFAGYVNQRKRGRDEYDNLQRPSKRHQQTGDFIEFVGRSKRAADDIDDSPRPVKRSASRFSIFSDPISCRREASPLSAIDRTCLKTTLSPCTGLNY
ncbi:uncharacterized protein BJ171DRAFT_605395, partial [Polychytrium aggregatum]|uniref:uncharacterized protein n=1 Tax=Polychytrium aggregatum TaxID=110093 RepID=UPI0022FE3A2A